MLKAVIVAAGRGSRMRAMTEARPKCLIEFAGRPLIAWQIDALRAIGVEEITVVVGYRAEALAEFGDRRVENTRWAETNTVYSLLSARETLLSGAPVIVGYSDLVYEARLLESLVGAEADVATVVDENWRALWEARFINPLSDAETLKRNAEGRILEIGFEPNGFNEIDGQFVGLTYFSPSGAMRFVEEWEAVRDGRAPSFAKRDAETCNFTDMLQRLIDQGTPVQSAPVRGGWLEFDNDTDFDLYQRWRANGLLDPFFLTRRED